MENSRFKFRAWLPIGDCSEFEDEQDYKMTTDLAFEEYDTINNQLKSVEYLMQYTGLKDKNGVEIYEGDIVETYSQNNKIEFIEGVFRLIGIHGNKYLRNYASISDFLLEGTLRNISFSKYDGITTTLKVIGNIYENPELL